MRPALLLLLAACSGSSDSPDPIQQVGTTLATDGSDADFDGVPDDLDCEPDDASVYPGAHDAPGDGIDADCDGEDPMHAWVGEWDVVGVQALYTTYPVLLPESAEGTLDIAADGAASLDAQAALDPDITGVPIEVFAILVHEGHASVEARADQTTLYLTGLVSVPTFADEISYTDLACTLDEDDDDAMYCQGTLKALEITLATEMWLER